MQNKLNVAIQSSQSYPVEINRGWPDAGHFPDTGKMLVIIDQQVDQFYGNDLKTHFESIADQLFWYKVPSGERSKSLEEFSRIMDYALEHQMRRNTPVVAVGGGVTGDLAGFAAACLLRGVPLYHLPTTLLAMVDSSIGGKTGVNHPAGKNLIGAFYQPRLVWANMDVLASLPRNEWNCGMGEVLKYGCIANRQLLDQAYEVFEHQTPENAEALAFLIRESAKIKVDIVCEDEKEAGKRSYLNFGHTFAHAIEAFTGYSRFSHGEAVYTGLTAALWISRQLGAPVSEEALLPFARYYKLNTLDLCTSVKELVSLMESDKKNLNNTIRIVTLKNWQKPETVELDDRKMLEAAFEFALKNVHNPI